MRLHLTTLLFIILEQINKIFTQTMPISPCPKMFQYRFDGNEWFGVLSVRNPDFVQSLHLKVTLSMRGKPTTNYLGEIELLTRGQFRSDSSVLYKVKFPKTHLPPRLLQIMANNQVICLGAADHSIFVTQIILEHTRKFRFISNTDNNDGSIPLPSSLTSDFLTPPSLSDGLADGGGDGEGDHIKESDSLSDAHVGFGTKHFSFEGGFEKTPIRGLQENCGKIDERIRFQIVQAISLPPGYHTVAQEQHTPPKDNVATMSERLLHSPTTTEMRSSNINGANSGIPLITTTDDDESQISSTEHSSGNVMSNKTTTATTIDAQTPTELPSITRGAWPWLAAIYVNNLTSLAYQCGGTLVSARIVISSAHCFHMYQKRYTANEVLVFLGRHNLRNWNEEGSLAAPVDDIFIHPDYDSHLNTYDADIAVVLLKHEIRFNTFIRPACMWSGSTKLQYIEGELGIVVGWGLANLNVANASTTIVRSSAVPRIVSAPVVTNEVCFNSNPQYQSLSSNRTFCAGAVIATSTKTPAIRRHRTQVLLAKTRTNSFANTVLCTGDSGAGLMIYKNNRWVLRGIVSASLALTDKVQLNSKKSHNCSRNQYVIYTDVAKFLDWIYAFII